MNTCVISLLVLLSVFLTSNIFAQTHANSSIVLHDNWSIKSSANLADDGKVISQLGYASNDWYPTSVPSIVLAALVANKVYSDPYYGNNYMELPGVRRWDKPEGNPFESSWWLLPRYPESSPVFFVRCQLFDETGKLVVENTYWKSQKDDDLGERANDIYMTLKQEKWADMTALNTMSAVNVEIKVQLKNVGKESHVAIRLHNPSTHIAFFERVTISSSKEGNEILPIKYSDNYVTVFPGEIVEIHGIVRKSAEARWVKLEGYNTPAFSVPIK